jgi:hypothetical protein
LYIFEITLSLGLEREVFLDHYVFLGRQRTKTVVFCEKPPARYIQRGVNISDMSGAEIALRLQARKFALEILI